MTTKAASQRRGESSRRTLGSGARPLAARGEHAPAARAARARPDEAPRERARAGARRRASRRRAGTGSSRRPRSSARLDVAADVEPVREAPADELGDQREQRERESRENSAGASEPAACAQQCASSNVNRPSHRRATELAEQRQLPARLGRALEAEQQDALPLAEAELAVGERDLLGARAEQQAQEPLALALLLGNQPRQQLLEVGEEARSRAPGPVRARRRRAARGTRSRSRSPRPGAPA